MTGLRFDFQQQIVEQELSFGEDLILNVGCNTDPGNLKDLSPDVVVNCDLFAHDQVLDRPNRVDVLFDAAAERWPFDDGAAGLVVLGDILEHLKQTEILFALREARRVSRRLCVTVPCDDRESNCDAVADGMPRGAVHRTIVTEELLRHLLAETGWTVTEWQEVEYDSGAFWGKRVVGFFVLAE
jgi:hypothetical protein